MKRVLYIDDEADSEKFASRKDLLAERGIDAEFVASVKDALAIVEGGVRGFSAVVLDLIMPPGETFGLKETAGGTATGLSLLERLRENDRSTPVVIVSIRRKEELRDPLTRFEVAEFVPKAGGTTDRIADAILRAIESAGRQ